MPLIDMTRADFDERMAIPTRNRLLALRRWHEERTPQAASAYYAAYHAWLRCYEAILATDHARIAA